MCGLGYILDVSIYRNRQSYHTPEPARPSVDSNDSTP
jgi:hypothetical protein